MKAEEALATEGVNGPTMKQFRRSQRETIEALDQYVEARFRR